MDPRYASHALYICPPGICIPHAGQISAVHLHAIDPAFAAASRAKRRRQALMDSFEEGSTSLVGVEDAEVAGDVTAAVLRYVSGEGEGGWLVGGERNGRGGGDGGGQEGERVERWSLRCHQEWDDAPHPRVMARAWSACGSRRATHPARHGWPPFATGQGGQRHPAGAVQHGAGARGRIL